MRNELVDVIRERHVIKVLICVDDSKNRKHDIYEKENNSDDLKVYYKIEFLYFKKRWDVLVYNVDFFFYFKLMIRCLSHLNI